MKKRILAVLLCMAMSFALLAGCGGSNGDSSADGDSAEGQTYTMKMHLSIGETDPVYKSAEVFAQTVNEKRRCHHRGAVPKLFLGEYRRLPGGPEPGHLQHRL